MQYMAFRILKGYLLHAKRTPFANSPDANENRKQNPSCL